MAPVLLYYRVKDKSLSYFSKEETMIQEYVIIVFEGLASVILVNIFAIGIYTAFNRLWINDFKAITADWMNFMRRGIPIPADFPKMEERFPGETTALPLEFRPGVSTFATSCKSTFTDQGFQR